MFIFHERYEFDWPVTVTYPAAEGAAEVEFTARFVLVDEDELLQRPEDDLGAAELIQFDRARLADRLIGWQGIQTPDGADLPYSAEARDNLIRQRPIREALNRAYFEAVFGGEQRAKN